MEHIEEAIEVDLTIYHLFHIGSLFLVNIYMALSYWVVDGSVTNKKG